MIEFEERFSDVKPVVTSNFFFLVGCLGLMAYQPL